MNPIAGITDEIVRDVFHGFNPISNALLEIYPGSQFTVRGYTYDDIEWGISNTMQKPSVEIIELKVRELLEKQTIKNDYIPPREKEYPTISEQLDMLYWDKMNGTNIWMETIQNIKMKYPKPSTS